MDLPQRTRGFIARDMEDDALGFDPITLVPKAQTPSEPKIDLEADAPAVKEIVSPKVEDAVPPVPEEPIEEELAEAGTDPDTPVDSSDVESDQELQAAVDFVGR
jgi:hypothetical protein